MKSEKRNKKKWLDRIPVINMTEKGLTGMVLSMVFLSSGIYLYWFGDYLFFYQENISLFLFSGSYFHQFAIKPGGLLEYAGNFLAQGYYSTLYGSLILSAVIALFTYLMIRTFKKLAPGRPLPFLLVLVPSCILLLMQLNFNWFMWNNLGLLAALICFLLSVASEKKRDALIVMAFFPLFYYIAGVFAWIYLGMYMLHSLAFKRGRSRFVNPFVLLVIAGTCLALSREIIFLQPAEVLLLSPFSIQEKLLHVEIMYLLAGFVLFFPLLVKFFLLLYPDKKYHGTFALASVVFVFIAGGLLFMRLYDTRISNLFQLEKDVYRQDWKAVINKQESYRLSNPVAQYYYNLALSEEGLLCERMFFGPQDFGPNALAIPWDPNAGVNNIARGSYFYYAIGLINEAHRWAYESMVAQGYRPENIKMLIKTDLINGHYEMAGKYLHILKRTLHYRNWARKYETMLFSPDLVRADPELGGKLKLRPEQDFTFRINNLKENFPLILQGNKDNRVAFEYMMAWLMLEKNIPGAMHEFSRLNDLSYIKIPRHIEEAIITYNITTGLLPELDSLEISDETVARFRDYEIYADPVYGIGSAGGRNMSKPYKDTYWYYFDFK